MEIKELKEKIEELRKEIIKHCYRYYVKSRPTILDYAFDMRFKELQRLEEELEESTGELPPDDSPTQMIWGSLEDQYPDWAKE